MYSLELPTDERGLLHILELYVRSYKAETKTAEEKETEHRIEHKLSTLALRVPLKSFSLAILVSSTNIFKILFAYKN